MNIDMTDERTVRNILAFSVPLFWGSILQNLYNIIDTVIVGRFVGKEALAIVGNLFAPMLLVNSIIAGSASGITILISYYYGDRNFTEIKSMYSSILNLAVAMSCFLLIFGIVGVKQILEWMKIPKYMLEGGCLYFKIVTIGFPFSIVYNYLAAIFKGLGDSKAPLCFLSLSCLANLILDIVCVSLFNIGIVGVALATVLSQIISAVCMALFFLNKEKLSLKMMDIRRADDWQNIVHILKYGITSTIQNSFSALSMMYIQSVVNEFGVDVITAFSAAYKIETILTVPAVSLGSSLGVFVGQNKGSGNTKKMVEGLYITMAISLVLFIIVNLLIWPFGGKMLHLIVGNENKVIYYGNIYLRITAVFYFFLTMLYLFTNFLRSSGEVIYPVFNTLLELGSRILLVFILSRYFGVMGVFLGRPVSFFVSMFSLMLRYKSGSWKNKIF